MEQNPQESYAILPDANKLFKEMLQTSFEKVRKVLPKKYSELHTQINIAQNFLKNDQDLNANKYFGIYKDIIDLKNTKLLEICFYYIQKLVAYNFLDGNYKDFIISKAIKEASSDMAQKPKGQRQLIDSMVETIANCVKEKDEHVQLQVCIQKHNINVYFR